MKKEQMMVLNKISVNEKIEYDEPLSCNLNL